ncbi:hypothetical protein VNO80_30002 [Phaseolus coccineus]|uniref:Uncharacterized protein n=1 Tax=Phaseolus coccineus TaxID=3886 RepID=A0AAN9LC13_PHACN
MAKASLLFPCLIVLFFVVFATGSVNAKCSFPCHSPHGCDNILHCYPRGCVRRCVNFCCQCDCTANENVTIT